MSSNLNLDALSQFEHHRFHQKMLAFLNVKPLLTLGLRLGEGTGAALALPLIQASAAFYNDMASFAQAEVTDVTDTEAHSMNKHTQ